MKQAQTGPVPGSCRSCTHWVSDRSMTPAGLCNLNLEATMIDDWCPDQDSAISIGDMHGFILTERECRVCGNVAVYSAMNWGCDWCVYDH